MSEEELVQGFTPTQRRILSVLQDGYRHDRDELLACIDELASPGTLQVHMTNLRKKLAPRNEDIVCQNRHGYSYQWVRLLCDSGCK